jgi:hypothetical protein
VEIAKDGIITQDNEECMLGVDCGSLDESRHAPQLMRGGTLTDDGETTPIKEPVEELPEMPATKAPTKIEWNRVVPATACTIDQIRGLWSKVAQGGNINKTEFTEIGRKGNPIKQPIQSNETTKIPGPQDTPENANDGFSNKIRR